MFKIFSQSKYTYLFFLIFIFFPHVFNKVQSSNLKISTLSSSQEYSSFSDASLIYENEYLLGPGDKLLINFLGTPIFIGCI